MAERMVIIDDELAELLREHLPAIVGALRNVEAAPPAGYSVVDGAHQLAISPRSLQRMIDSGEVRVVRFGTRVVIPRSEIDRLLEAPAPAPVRKVG